MTQDDRYPSVTLAGFDRVPDASLRLFVVSACLGRTKGTLGFMDISNINRPVGVEIAKKKRQEILERVGLSRQTWSRTTKSWVDRRMAHRCRRGVVFLFLSPQDGLAAQCPGCSERLIRWVNDDSHGGSNMTHAVGQTPVQNGGCNGDEEGGSEPSRFFDPEKALREIQQAEANEISKLALARVKETLGAEEVQ